MSRFIASGLLFLMAVGCFRSVSPSTVTIGGRTITVSVADTLASQTKGLAGVAELSWDEGMLFMFSAREQRIFWMKGMRIPIDIIWIDDGRVVGVEHDVPAPSPDRLVKDEELPRYTSPAPVRYVLEVRSGFSKQYGISAGDTVTIDP